MEEEVRAKRRIVRVLLVLTALSGFFALAQRTTCDESQGGACCAALLSFLVAALVIYERDVRILRGVVRREAGRCVKCGYSLRGLTATRCPECGTPFEAAHDRHGPSRERNGSE